MVAKLKETARIDVCGISLDFFEPEENSVILDAFFVDGGNLVLVKEVVFGGLAYTFFDVKSQEKIDKSTRYNSENGKVFTVDAGGGYCCLSKVMVDQKTGFESLIEKVVKDGEVVYQGERERYVKNERGSVFDRYLEEKERELNNRDAICDFGKKFGACDFDGKVDYLRGLFRKSWRDGCELGFENPEFFFPSGLYKELVIDKEFKSALREMLEREEVFTGVKAETLYSSILNYYG